MGINRAGPMFALTLGAGFIKIICGHYRLHPNPLPCGMGNSGTLFLRPNLIQVARVTEKNSTENCNFIKVT
jgi:hypothetical protein